MKHYIQIRSAYRDPVLSRQRLELSQKTIIPCLTSQTAKDAVIVLRVRSDDPFRRKRLDAFTSTGFDVVTSSDIPAGRRITTRLDDDDAVAKYFIETVRKTADRGGFADDVVLTFPNGYVWCGGKLRPWTLAENMFTSLVSDGGSIMDIKHRALPNHFPIHHIGVARAWVWVRHDSNMSTLAVGHLKNKPLQSSPMTLPFAVDWGSL